MIWNQILNFAIALGVVIIATASVNAVTGAKLALYHVAPFIALWLAVRHAPPPFKD